MLSREQMNKHLLEITRNKEEEDAVREITTRILVGQYLAEYFSDVTFEKRDYYSGFPSSHKEAFSGCDYGLKCNLNLFPEISREDVDVTEEFDPRCWRRIKSGPKQFLVGGYMSVQKVNEHMDAILSKATEACRQNFGRYRIHPFSSNKNSAIKSICVEGPNQKKIAVFIIFSFRIISFKSGYLDDDDSFDLLAVPYDISNQENNTDIWLVSRCGIDKEEAKLREKEINKEPVDRRADEKLITCLEKVKTKFLAPRNGKDLGQYQKLVVQRKVVEQLLQLHLSDIFDDFMLAGGSYEMTAIPGIADYDLECCLKMPSDVLADNVEECGYKGWRKIRGGPIQFLEGEYLSVQKVRRHVYTKLEDALKRSSSGTRYQLELKEFDRSSASIKMIIKDGPESCIDVDLVLCIKLSGLRHPTDGQSYGLIAKAFNKNNPDECSELWRITVSKHEVLMFESHRYDSENDSYEERWYTYQTMKLVKVAEENEVLNVFPSYFYKQAFMLQAADRADRPLHIRFKEYIYVLVKSLEQHRLIEKWMPDEPNLLDRWSPEEVKPAKEFLKSVLKEGSYHKLLEPILKPTFKLHR